jgi:hypothetical protein
MPISTPIVDVASRNGTCHCGFALADDHFSRRAAALAHKLGDVRLLAKSRPAEHRCVILVVPDVWICAGIEKQAGRGAICIWLLEHPGRPRCAPSDAAAQGQAESRSWTPLARKSAS